MVTIRDSMSTKGDTDERRKKAMLIMAKLAKLIWLTVLFLVGCVSAMILIVAGFTYAVKVAEDIREGDKDETLRRHH